MKIHDFQQDYTCCVLENRPMQYIR